MRPVISNSYAMEGASNQHTCYYRSEFDMSVPLPPNVVFPELAPVLPLDREYFLTFKVCSRDHKYTTVHPLRIARAIIQV